MIVNVMNAFGERQHPDRSLFRTQSWVPILGQGVTGDRIDLYWSPRRNIRGGQYCHVIGPIGISAVTIAVTISVTGAVTKNLARR